MSTAIAETRSQQMTIKQHLTSPAMAKQVQLALPKHMKADRMMRVALTALTRTPKLAQCDQNSFFKCLMDCSAMGLEPDGRLAHLIPYGSTCTLVIDYKGLVALAKRSGQVSNIYANIVCEKDFFKFDTGKVTHEVDFKSDRGKVYAVCAVVYFKDGTSQADCMTRDEVEAIRKRSKAANSGPWVTDWNEMAKKTVFRRLSKWVELSPEFRDALDKDDDSPVFTAVEAAPAITLNDLVVKVKETTPTTDETHQGEHIEDDNQEREEKSLVEQAREAFELCTSPGAVSDINIEFLEKTDDEMIKNEIADLAVEYRKKKMKK